MKGIEPRTVFGAESWFESCADGVARIRDSEDQAAFCTPEGTAVLTNKAVHYWATCDLSSPWPCPSRRSSAPAGCRARRDGAAGCFPASGHGGRRPARMLGDARDAAISVHRKHLKDCLQL